ncbi:MAG: rhodanese-like domain-containing protein [Gammaproteobacteria bacterium]|nr:rhodanese-like domain-containing protein [Gammaproteobacteria bacterium]
MPDLDPKQAFDLLASRPEALLLDVRSRVEYDYVGHPVGALHVAWKEFPAWSENPDFLTEVRRAIAAVRPEPVEAVPVLAICRSGARSRAAAQALERAGFRELYNVAEGFEGDKDAENHRNTVNGWRARGLPWEQT